MKKEKNNQITIALFIGIIGMSYMLLVAVLGPLGIMRNSMEGMEKIHFYYNPFSYFGILSSLVESFIFFFVTGLVAVYLHNFFFNH